MFSRILLCKDPVDTCIREEKYRRGRANSEPKSNSTHRRNGALAFSCLLHPIKCIWLWRAVLRSMISQHYESRGVNYYGLSLVSDVRVVSEQLMLQLWLSYIFIQDVFIFVCTYMRVYRVFRENLLIYSITFCIFSSAHRMCFISLRTSRKILMIPNCESYILFLNHLNCYWQMLYILSFSYILHFICFSFYVFDFSYFIFFFLLIRLWLLMTGRMKGSTVYSRERVFRFSGDRYSDLT